MILFIFKIYFDKLIKYLKFKIIQLILIIISLLLKKNKRFYLKTVGETNKVSTKTETSTLASSTSNATVRSKKV